MKLPERLVALFDYPVGDILAAMPDTSSPLWDVNPHRQTKHKVHGQTRSLIFEWIDDRWLKGRPAEVTRFDCPLPVLAGVAYEFDNTRFHAVDNDRPRIHLMCDILPASLIV